MKWKQRDQNVYNRAETLLQGKFIAISTYIKTGSSQSRCHGHNSCHWNSRDGSKCKPGKAANHTWEKLWVSTEVGPATHCLLGTWVRRNSGARPIPLHCGWVTNVGSTWDPTTHGSGGPQGNVKIKLKAISGLQPNRKI